MAVVPVYGIEQRMLLTLLEDVVGPTSIRSVLYIYVAIAELCFLPLLSDDCAKPVKRTVIGSVNNAMVVQAPIRIRFNNGHGFQLPAVQLCGAAENSMIESIAEMSEIG